MLRVQEKLPTGREEILHHIQSLAIQMVDEDVINSEDFETARLLLGALFFRTVVADELASLLDLSREFVRVRASRLRQNGVWVKGKYLWSVDSDEYLTIEFLFHLLCAQGLIVRSGTSEDGEPCYRIPDEHQNLHGVQDEAGGGEEPHPILEVAEGDTSSG